MRIILFLLFFIVVLNFSKAQVALGYFPWNYSTVQVTSNPDKLVFADFRFETNSAISNLNFSLAGQVNAIRKESYNLYIGAGASAYPFFNDDQHFLNGYFANIGVRWMPLPMLRQLALVFELTPNTETNFESGRIESYLGISYHFGK